MPQNIFAFTAGDPAARANLKISIAQPFTLSAVEGHISEEELAAIRTLDSATSGLYAWGAVPGHMNDRYYKALQVGDWMLCVYGGRYRFVSKVTHKIDSPKLAAALWGSTEKKKTWQYMFFLEKPVTIDVGLDELVDFLPKQFYGFARVGDENTARIIQTFGTVDRFINEKLLLRLNQPTANYDLSTVRTETRSQHFIVRADPLIFDVHQKSFRFASTDLNDARLLDGGRIIVESAEPGKAHLFACGVVGPARTIAAEGIVSSEPVHYESVFAEWHEFEIALPLPKEFEDQLQTRSEHDEQPAVRSLEGALFDAILEYMNAPRREFKLGQVTLWLNRADVVTAFESIAVKRDRPSGPEPYWLLQHGEKAKPVSQVFRSLRGVARDTKFNTRDATTIFGLLGFTTFVAHAHVENDRELCLIGTSKDSRWAIEARDQISKSGHYAYWWSFRLRPDAEKQLTARFQLYVNSGHGKLTHRLACTAVVSARGADGVASPWPEHTIVNERGVSRFGDKSSQVCTTWFLVVSIETLSPPLTVAAFDPAEPWSKTSSLLNQNAFGYAYARDVIVEDKLEIQPESMEPFTIDDAMKDLFVERAEFERALRLLNAKKNLILQGSPGVGKTFVAKRLAYATIGLKSDSHVETVQFHQAYSYEDFIQGFRPKSDGAGFAIRDGVFHRFCDLARKMPNQNFVFVIDEINRGNLGKIFGELLMLIEGDKRGPAWGLRLAYSDEHAPRFHVPANVYIIGMMNTADRSLTTIDYALRRRFAFMKIRPAFDQPGFAAFLESQGWSAGSATQIGKRFVALNTKIAADEELRDGFCVGHSYFCGSRPQGMTDGEIFAEIIESEIRPLLEDYWFDKSPQDIASIVSELGLT